MRTNSTIYKYCTEMREEELEQLVQQILTAKPQFLVYIPISSQYKVKFVGVLFLIMSDWLLFNHKWAIYSHIMARTSYIRWNDNDVYFVLDQHDKLDIYSASSLKQQFAGWYVDPLTHYPDSEQTSLCSYSLMLHTQWRTTK